MCATSAAGRHLQEPAAAAPAAHLQVLGGSAGLHLLDASGTSRCRLQGPLPHSEPHRRPSLRLAVHCRMLHRRALPW
jgi:hypothetical protein